MNQSFLIEKGQGWWKYEICLGKHVMQYHEVHFYLFNKKCRKLLKFRFFRTNKLKNAIMSYWVLGMLKSIRNGLKRIQTNDHCQTKTKERININIISIKYISNMIIENLIAYAGFFLFITLMGTCVKIKKDLWKSD